MVKEPRTLQQAVIFFSEPKNCLEYMASRRWPNGITCPVCGAKSVSYLASVNRYQCSKRHPKRQFTAKTGTIFEDSPLGLDRWLVAMWLIVNCKNGISSYELARAIGVCQKTAWFMNHRIRLAMQNGSLDKLSGTVEADETYVGGKAKNMHFGKRTVHGRGGVGKTVVMGLLERHGSVRTFVIRDAKAKRLHQIVRAHVVPGSRLYTDHLMSYRGLKYEYDHEFVSHIEEYVRDEVHTNGLENFWSLLKRSIKGTYVSVEPFHLFRYCDEQAFRFNERKGTDASRFNLAVSQVSGKRLTYANLTGKEGGL